MEPARISSFLGTLEHKPLLLEAAEVIQSPHRTCACTRFLGLELGHVHGEMQGKPQPHTQSPDCMEGARDTPGTGVPCTAWQGHLLHLEGNEMTLGWGMEPSQAAHNLHWDLPQGFVPQPKAKLLWQGRGSKYLRQGIPHLGGFLWGNGRGSANTGHTPDTADPKGRDVSVHFSFRHPRGEGCWCLDHFLPFHAPHQLHARPDGLPPFPGSHSTCMGHQGRPKMVAGSS